MKTEVAIGIAVLAVLSVSIVVLGCRSDADGRYQYHLEFDPGIYVIVMNKYQRLGDDVERSVHVLERSTLENRFTITAANDMTNVSTRITGDGKEYLITLDSDNMEQITDVSTDIVTQGFQSPPVGLPSQPDKAQVIKGLENSGAVRVAEKQWHGRTVYVYEAAGDEEGANYYRVVSYLDEATGMVVYTARYMSAAEGTETLVEWFELTSIQKED